VTEVTLKVNVRLSVILRAWAPKHSPREVVGALVVEARRRAGAGRPILLCSHSTGANRALWWQISHPEERLAGIVASTLATVLSRLAPSITMKGGLDLANLSRDFAAVEANRRDPLFRTKVSPLQGVGFLRSWAWFARWPDGTLASPVLIFPGTAGRLKGDATLKTWDGFYHVIHRTPEKDEVRAFIAGWMDKRAA
jgi:alpha-beta hydrolase superfamily lysophospholipase